MKTDEIAVLAAAGVAVWLILKGSRPAGAAGGTRQGSSGINGWVNEIFSPAGTPYSNGWRYFENGVAISPQGDYYLKGQKVWSAPK
jgi:hypothetical protein